MEWKILIFCVIGGYILYYGVVILMDVMKKNDKSDSLGYEMVEMETDEQDVQNVEVEDYKRTEVIDNPLPNKKKNEGIGVSIGEITGQGMPVDEWKLYAKNLSANIEY